MSKAVDFSFINPSDIMLKSEYDTNLNSIVDVAASVQGVDGAIDNTFYGKVGGIAGFYSVQTEYAINDLTDVTITTPTSGQYIKYNGTAFVNTTIDYSDITGTPILSSVATSGSYSDLSDKPVIPAVPDSVGDLSDVDITGISNGQVLQWSGSTFIPANVSAGGAGSLNELSDVTLTSVSSGQILKYNGTVFVNTTIDYSDVTNTPTLSTVAISGDYDDLNNKPVIFSGSYDDLAQQPFIPERLSELDDVNLGGIVTGQTIQWNGSMFIPVNMDTGGSGGSSGSLNELSDVTLTSVSSGQILKYNGTAFVNTTIDYSDITGTPTLSSVATSGSYSDLSDKPAIFSGSYNDLSDKPVLSTVATSGSYSDLSDKPAIFSGSYNDLSDKPVLSTVASSGSYDDLVNQPSIPSTLTQLSDVGYLVASSGQVLRHNGTMFTNATLSYNDLSDTPVLPSVPDSIGDLSDVNISSISTGQVLQWDGSGFVPATISGGSGGASTLNELTDVNVSSATSGQVLQYNGSNWIPATVAGGSGNTTVERIRIQYTGADMAAGTVGTSECYSGYSANVTPILVRNESVSDFITEISFTGYNYPPSHIMYYGFNGANNRYEIRPLSAHSGIQYVPNNTTDLINPSPFGAFDKIRLTTASSDTGAAPKTGLPTTPGHAWIVLVMQG